MTRVIERFNVAHDDERKAKSYRNQSLIRQSNNTARMSVPCMSLSLEIRIGIRLTTRPRKSGFLTKTGQNDIERRFAGFDPKESPACRLAGKL